MPPIRDLIGWRLTLSLYAVDPDDMEYIHYAIHISATLKWIPDRALPTKRSSWAHLSCAQASTGVAVVRVSCSAGLKPLCI